MIHIALCEPALTRCNFPCSLSSKVGKRNPLQEMQGISKIGRPASSNLKLRLYQEIKTAFTVTPVANFPLILGHEIDV